MNSNLMRILGAFYVIATILIVMTIYRHTDRSWLVVAESIALWMVSVVLPARWTVTIAQALRQRGVDVEDLQYLLVMPSWCAGVTALIALQFIRS